MIRFAVPGDIDGINILHKQLHIQHIGYRPDIFAQIEQPKFDSLMMKYLNNKNRRIIISENDNVIDGYAALTVCNTKKAEGEIQPFVYVQIDEFCVLEGHEHKGIGSAIMDEAKTFALSVGARFLELSVRAENTGALEFYKANGLSVRSLKMQYRIDDTDERKV